MKLQGQAGRRGRRSRNTRPNCDLHSRRVLSGTACFWHMQGLGAVAPVMKMTTTRGRHRGLLKYLMNDSLNHAGMFVIFLCITRPLLGWGRGSMARPAQRDEAGGPLPHNEGDDDFDSFLHPVVPRDIYKKFQREGSQRWGPPTEILPFLYLGYLFSSFLGGLIPTLLYLLSSNKNIF